jgi:DNA relaxase NicK
MQDARAEFAHVRTCEWMTSLMGDTFYMGSRSSTQFARCYNARGFTRFEMELKKERAE